ncbi:MAG: hypothetical protein K2I63_00660 [Helicobacter sp.]|nr:hypothetical protein [Helicobacter sp.]
MNISLHSKAHYLFLCLSLGALMLLFSACADHASVNNDFEKAFTQKYCNEGFFEQNLNKAKTKNDTIYIGLNTGLIARNCSEFDVSNTFFDVAEESYKEDVDLEDAFKKGAKLATTTLVNDSIVDYQGSLYERIMVNVYKGLNFMSLKDSVNARVEFNRALMRQDKAKEYFANQIQKNREEIEESKNDPNYNKNMDDNVATITKEYEHLFEEFETTKDFINPYATYLASVFFFMERDYRRASDLFKEIAIINPENEEIIKESKVFAQRANEVKSNASKYIFVVYENGMGVVKDEFSLTLPFLVDEKIVTTSIALQTLKKRNSSFEYMQVNGVKTTQIIDLDSIVATEFKINMPTMVAKALAQTILKTTINVAVAKNDPTGGWLSLASSLITSATSRADIRSWLGLPKSVSVAMVENKGELEIKDSKGGEVFKGDIESSKDVLVFVRSFAPYLPNYVQIIQ